MRSLGCKMYAYYVFTLADAKLLMDAALYTSMPMQLQASQALPAMHVQ